MKLNVARVNLCQVFSTNLKNCTCQIVVSLTPCLEGQPKPCTRVVVTDKAFEVKNLDDVIT